MKINARDPGAAARYGVFVDGVDISGITHEADDVAHVVTVVVLGRDGKAIRNDRGEMLLAKVYGHVAIVSRVSEPMPEKVQ